MKTFTDQPNNSNRRVSAVAMAIAFLACASPAAAQLPDITSSQQSETSSASKVESMFPDSIGGKFFLGGQVNVILQTNAPFKARYGGPNSLPSAAAEATSRVMTLYTGYQWTKTIETLVDVEAAGGGGLGQALGLGGFSNLDAVRNPSLGQQPYLARLMFHEVVALSNRRIEADPGPLSTFSKLPARRLEIRAGKFGMVDFFDINGVGSDSHLQFMNWAIAQNGAYDFAADTRGYTYGGILEFQDRAWGFRFAEALMPSTANGIKLVWDLRRARSESYEFELHRGILPKKKDGAVRLLAYTNHANMGIYRDAINQYLNGQVATPDISNHPAQTDSKYGFGINLEQALTRNLTAFGRFGWNNGKTESYAYTEIDQTFAGGIAVNGRKWGRRQDRFGLACASNALSGDHRRYLAWGGSGFILGDGALDYGREKILETYYTLHLGRGVYVAPALQYIVNPGYNRDRGPVVIPGFRLHVEL